MEPITYTLVVEGPPIPKARPRFGNGRAYTPQRTKDYENKIKSQLDEVTILGPVHVNIVAVFPRPQRLNTKKYPNGQIWHTKRPDLDNIIKAVLDALNKKLGDDAQVCSIEALKVYAERTSNPRTEIYIKTLKELP